MSAMDIQVEQKSEEQVANLWQSYVENPTHEVRSELVKQYLPLVKYIAGRITGNLPSVMSWDDLFHSGVVGLIEAVDRFDPSQQVKFKTFAYTRIRGAMIDELRRVEWGPRSLRDAHKRLEATIEELQSELNTYPTDEQIAEALDVTIDEYYEMLHSVSKRYMLSLDYMYDDGEDDESFTIKKSIEQTEHDEPLDALVKAEEKERLVKIIDHLPDQEKMVIALYYYEELTLREIGEVIGVSESRVSQIHTKVLLYLESVLR
ncbi:MAG: FliA/WhiG family RNA polymerase sigma factor [Candidatus Marinimicrobia bacterium]|nr:FliA/WhiG family RNA polymerase sigma factor [Candidatus Neomarinimicrobiota bacterium]MCF7880521.1 FliA/WhiG family RNA polymerase sigma factor [Candidatus Neomarinimicrobiota bacterium]